MLPKALRGPEKRFRSNEDPSFVERNSAAFPFLDPDFISQICYEHPGRFDDLFPFFDVARHAAVRTTRTAAWIEANVRYEGDEEVRMWSWHIDKDLESGEPRSPEVKHVLEHGTWPFPPVVVEASLASRLGARHAVGRPYELVEGTHRTSYFLRVLALRRIAPTSSHELIEIVERDAA
jgi:hypothetical protein